MKGILHFSNDSKLTADVPVEVRKSNLAVVGTGMTSDSMELEPGDYFVTARMPAGQELYGEVKLSAGEEATVKLAPDLADESPQESQAAPHYLLERRRETERREILKKFERDSLTQIREKLWKRLKLDRKVKFFRRNLNPPTLRFFRGNLFDDVLTDVTKQLQPFNLLEPAKNLVQIRIGGNDDGFLLVQMTQPGTAALNMVLPVFSDAGCTLVIKRDSAGFYALDANLKNFTADLLLRYTHKGLQRQAESTAQAVNAEVLLYQKRSDPIAAAVGAYALLRFGELERLHEWTENLRQWFPLLPDGAAIRGEHLAREGHHEEAADAFLELGRRGVPVFSEGLSYAASRLRFYIKLIEGNKFERSYKEGVSNLLDKLQHFAAYTDFQQPITTFTGIKPTAPSDDERQVGASEGFNIEYFLNEYSDFYQSRKK